jgi:hypothetical protein
MIEAMSHPVRCFAATLLVAAAASPSGVEVPSRIQASLTAKAAPFDRSLAIRAGIRVVVLVIARRRDAESQKVADEFEESMLAEGEVANLPVRTMRIDLEAPDRIVAEILSRRPTIVFFSAGFAEEMPALATALSGVDVLTVAAEASAVAGGACLGFRLVSGKPHVLINLQQSRKQNVHFQAALLRLSTVTEP